MRLAVLFNHHVQPSMPQHFASSPRVHLLGLRSSCPFWTSGLESVLESPRDVLQMLHSSRASSLSSLCLLTPLVYWPMTVSICKKQSSWSFQKREADHSSSDKTYISGFWQLDSHTMRRYAFECEESDGL